MSVRDVDRGYRELVDRIFKMGRPKIHVGILEADGGHEHQDGLTVAAVAAIHEFGIGVPERSFLRAWFDENRERSIEAMRRMLVSVVEGKRTTPQALELFGQWVQSQIQRRIATGIGPGLSARTIKRKGSSVPLIDTGQLRSSISYRIEMADGSIKEAKSEAAVARHKKALAEKSAAKKVERQEARARAKERKAIRKQISKDVKATTKSAKKAVSRLAKRVKKLAR